MTEALEKLEQLLSRHKETLSRLADELGTPSTHVEQRLKALHESLCAAVELQRTDAEQEVDLVRKKVNSTRNDILIKRRALGDVTDEPARQKESLLAALARLEQVQADLSTAHTARLAQFANVYERLRAVLPVLGPDFLSQWVSIPPADSTMVPLDLTIATLSNLEKELDRCDQELHRRGQLFEHDLDEVIALWAELGIYPKEDSDSTEGHFDWLMLAHKKPDDPTQIEPTLEHLSRAQTARNWLEAEKERRQQLIQTIYEEDLYNLWVKLGVSEEDQDAFLEHWKGIEQRCVDAYLAEKERMLQLKAENMVIFIQRERDDIVRLGGEIYLSREEQSDWDAQHGHLDGDDLLEAYETRRKQLLAELERRAPVLIPLMRYEALRKEAQELIDSAKDQTRFKVRGDPGRLLREEKTRKRHAKEKPKLEAELFAVIPKWEAEHGEAFMVNGERYLDELSRMATSVKSTIPPRSKTPAGERAKTPAPGEQSRAKTPGPRPNTANGKSLNAYVAPSTAVKRAGTASVAATPLAVKRPRGNTQSEIKPFGTSIGNGGYTTMKPPARPASRAGGIPTLKYARQVSRDYKPRPSLTSLSSMTSVDSLLSHRTGSTAASSVYKVEDD